MNYNTDYINVKYALLSIFLINADRNILDISYDVCSTNIKIQVVLLNGEKLSSEIIKRVKRNLPEFVIHILELSITKEQFNETKGEWTPKYYTWLNYSLLSKAEIL